MKVTKPHIILFSLMIFYSAGWINTNAQQINISVVEQMPNVPAPYMMRNWKKVAAGYDSLVFNSSASGQYLPLIFDNNSTVNYLGQKSFGLHSYVGTTATQSGEAINVLPAIVGASLIGIDKSNQNGRNYVLESREYFNKRPEENIYLNQPAMSSGDDWWYETMPNVFFLQLYSLYPGTQEYNSQLTTVADRWLQAVYAMNASTTPWKIPGMNYRAWSFSSMAPNSSDVPEPEASGAIAWILYNAFKVTGDEKYRIGAELSMEYLNSLNSNPAYELQLPYGAYLAAKMNAELGTNYNIEKIINWCFNQGQLRNWGVTTGKWGVYDVNGLVGELSPRNYAFTMNTFEQIGALVPLVRYDSRFARAIGKWVLNAANSARLFYPNYLADLDQDNESWAKQYDPNSVIAYEALLKTNNNWIKGTGDAVAGGWSATNLGLYGSSHVGILGAIIDTTNVQMILKLDLLKTDYFHSSAYPSYLIFNPYNVAKDVIVNVGYNSSDVYDAVSHSIIASGVNGNAAITLPADQALVLVIIPSGSVLEKVAGKTVVGNVIIDFANGMSVQNISPRIKSLASVKTLITVNDSTSIFCTAVDKEEQQLAYSWKTAAGKIIGSDSNIKWVAPPTPGVYSVSVIVIDPSGEKDSTQIEITVNEFINYPPIINKIKAVPRKINIGTASEISCNAFDQNEETLNYSWTASAGIITGDGKTISWKAPTVEGNYFIRCVVSDSHAGSIADSICVEVRDFTKTQTGSLIAFYPFSGNANDQNGVHNGTVNGAELTKDRFGNTNQAYSFDGSTDNIDIANASSLNFGNAVTVSLWFKVGTLYNREAFLVSHGSWQNRWKISVTNKKIRWTIKTDAGVIDLDSETELSPLKLYLLTVIYSGKDLELWLNGELDSFASWSGKILSTSNDLMIAQMLQNDHNYTFNGVIDDVRLYDYALSVDEIKNLYDLSVSVENNIEIPNEFRLNQNYPNPFNPSTVINYHLAAGDHVTLKVYDMLGRVVVTLVDEYQSAGIYNSQFSIRNSQLSSGVYFYRLRVGDRFVQSKKMLLIK
jgi:hypothetical protein